MFCCSSNMATSNVEKRKLFMEPHHNAWRQTIHSEKEHGKYENKMKVEQRQRIDDLVTSLKKCREKQQQQQQMEFLDMKPTKEPAERNKYKNRFNAQKNMIGRLTLQLEEKNRLIEELKLGIFDKEALKSINQAKIDIHEIFANCSVKMRIKMPPPTNYNEKFMVTTQKAPKIVQELEEKALERAKKREIIQERRRIILEERQRMIEEALERKRIQDEEETKRNLQKIKEERRREMERRKKREANKMVYLEKLKASIDLQTRKLLQKTFKALFAYCKENKEKYILSVIHYNYTLMRKIVSEWQEFIENKYKDKKALADAVFAKKILTKCIKRWRDIHTERVRSMQVAEDFYDLILLNNSFVHWHRHVCIQVMLMDKKMKMAEKHSNKSILFHYFYQWRSLPVIIQLERTKEEKKRKWRAKVWEVIPDYKPPIDDY